MDSQLLVGGCCANWNVPISSQRIEIYAAEAQTFLVVGLCFTLLETLIFQSEDCLVPGLEKLSTCGQRMQFFLGKFQLSGQRIAIYIADPESLLLERLSSTLVGTNIFRPNDSMLPACETFTTPGQRMQFLLGKFQISGEGIGFYLAVSGSILLERLNSTVVETIISRPEN